MSDQLPLAGRSVLVIEDERLIVMEVEACLRDAGVACVETAGSMHLAKRIIESGRDFDAAIVDLHLAGEDTNSLLELLSNRGVPVVLTTGGIDGEEAGASHAAAVLRKPYPDGDLVKALAWIVGPDKIEAA